MTAKQFLEQYEDAMIRIDLCRQEYKKESDLIDAIRSTSDNDGLPHGTGISKPTEEKAIRLSDKAMRLIDAKLDAIRIRQEIFDVIYSIGGIEARVLYERYIELKQWDEVGKAVDYSESQAQRYHRKGLEKVSEKLGIK